MYLASLQAGTSLFTGIIGEKRTAIIIAGDAVDVLTASRRAADSTRAGWHGWVLPQVVAEPERDAASRIRQQQELTARRNQRKRRQPP